MTLLFNKTLTNEFFATLGAFSPNGRYRAWPPQSPFAILDMAAQTYTYNTPSNAIDINQLDACAIDDDGTIYAVDGVSDTSFYKVPSFGASDAQLLYHFDGSAGQIGNTALFISPVDASRRICLSSNDNVTLAADQRVYVYSPSTDTMDEIVPPIPNSDGPILSPFVQDMFGDIWAFYWDGTVFAAQRYVDFGSGSAAPDYTTLTPSITADPGCSATHTPSGWVVEFGNGEVLALLDTDDFSTITTRNYGASSIADIDLSKIPSGLTSFWLPSSDNGDPNFNFQGFEEIQASDLTTLDSHLISDWIDVGDTPDSIQSGTYVYSPTYSAFYTEYMDPDTSDLYSVIRYLGEEPTPPPTSGNVASRAWGFSLDGHDFYVLRLGDSHSLVYDLMTRQWSEWKNETLDYWRAHCGQNWQGMAATLSTYPTDVVAGDDTEGILWVLDPTAGRDDLTTSGSESFTRTVTGGISLSGRDVAPCNAVELTVALGAPTQTGAAFELSTSDNLGQTWLSHGTVTTSAGNYSQVVEWRALGTMQAPGRIFKITDNGATVRIGRADIR